MRKRLISILIANVLFLSNVGFTSLAVEQHIDDSIVAASEEETEAETDEESEEESQEASASDSYFDDIDYVKIQSFTELPEEIINQKLKLGGNIEELNFPDTLEIKVVADLDRADRIEEQLGRERELMRELEEEDAEAASSASSEDEEEEEEETEDEAGEGSSQMIDGESVIFFDSDSETPVDQATEESESDDEYQDYEEIEDSHEEISSESSSSGATINAPAEEPETTEETSEEPEQPNEEQESSDENDDAADEAPADEAPADEGNEDAGEDSEPSDDLISRIISVFRPLMVRAAEKAEEPAEDEGEESSEVEAEASDEDEVDESGEGSDATDYSEDVGSADYESIEMVSGIEWILDPSRSDAGTFSSDVLGARFTFVPVLVIPDYYYVEAELPTITVTIVDEYYAFDEVVSVDDVKIRVRADEGVFQEGATLFAQKLQEEDEKEIQDKVEEQLEENTKIVKAYTFDIQIRDRDGNEIEPDTEKGRVFVSFETEEVSNVDYDAEIYHIIEAEDVDNAEATAADGAEAKDEAESEEKAGEAKDAKGVDESAESVIPEYKSAEASEEKATVDGEFIIKKLEAQVVEGEEEKALEAETDSFSNYCLIFVESDVTKLTVNDFKPINIDDFYTNTLLGTGTISTVTFAGESAASVYATKLTQDAPSTDAELDVTTGVYKSGLVNYLIVKKPFSDAVVMTITDSNDSTYTVNVENTKSADIDLENGSYPYATELGDYTFMLEVPIPTASQASTDNIYQWQKSSDGSVWEDIPGANSYYYKNASVTTNGIWYHCIVNGVETEKVQIIIPRLDQATRPWTKCFGNNTQCYVSNGKVAYTHNLDSASTVQKRFDFVGEFDGKMLQTTINGEGWKLFSGSTSPITWSTIDYDLDSVYFRFVDTSSPKLIITANPTVATTSYFAIGANTKLGTVQKETTIAQTESSSSTTFKRIAIMATTDKDDAQKLINNGNGDTVPSLLLTPITTSNATRSLAAHNSQIPYGTSDKSSIEGSLSGIAMSWDMSGSTPEPVEFELSLAGMKTNDVLDEISKTGKSTPANFSSNIKSLKLSSDVPLDTYAKSDKAGDIYDEVSVQLKFASATSDGKSAIGNILPKYEKASTSSASTTSSSTTSSSSNSTAYSADYFDVNVKSYVNNSKTGESVPEIDDNVVIEISYDFTNKDDIQVFRYHENSAQSLSAGSGSEGTYKVDKSAGKIYVYTRKFSTFAVAYKPDTYYTVTFSGASVSSQKVKAGGKATKPADPTKEGYTFKGWYWYPNNPTKTVSASTSKSSSSSTSTSSSSSSEDASLYNFDNEVKSNITLTAGWASDTASSLEASKAAAKAAAEDDEGDVNGARAPKTHDDLPIVWLWVLLLVSGITTFGLSAKAIVDATRNPDQPKRRTKLQVYMLLAGILIKTTIKFIARKIRENKAKALLGLSTAVILVSCIVLASTLLQYHKTESLYSDADVTYVETGDGEEVDEYVQEIKELAGEEDRYDWWDCAQVNLKELKEEYPEVVGWIYFENENISYPIMYSGDNDKYLKTTYTGEKAKAGAIFIDGESTPDFTDPHSLIYGHNMRDLSMFGRLRYYTNTPGYYEDHQYFQIFTEDKVYRYQIFAYEEVADNHDVFWVYGKEPTGYYKMLKEIESGSYCNSGITTNESDHVITLATCTNKDDRRLIVSAVRTDEYEYAQ